MQSQEIVKEFSKGVVLWYHFGDNPDILYVYEQEENDVLEKFLREKAGKGSFCAKSVAEIENEKKIFQYDVIIALNVVECYETPVELLQKLRSLLKISGRLLLGTENRLGLKYFCGDRDPFTNHSFDGIEHYCRLSAMDRKSIKGRCYSKDELKTMLSSAGFEFQKFYAVLPNIQEAQLIYAEQYSPVEELSMRYFPIYNYPDSVFIEEGNIYTDLIKNGMFHAMANAFLVECCMRNSFDSTLHATISLDRGPKNALVTSIYTDKNGNMCVTKRPAYPEGYNKLEEMQKNAQDLKKHGVNVVESVVEHNGFSMSYIDAPIAMNALRQLAMKDREEFVQAIDTMRELILNSSEHSDVITDRNRNSANGRELGVILSRGYIDMVPLNCFYIENEENIKDRFLFYDQEFYWENCPANAIIYRALGILYDIQEPEFENVVPKSFFMERYGLNECKDIWERMGWEFTDILRNQKELTRYNSQKKCDARTLYTNRQKINYNTKDYQRIFVNIFDGIEEAREKGVKKKIILFGSGIFASKFIAQFSSDYELYSIIDNNEKKWGTELEGVPICSPDILYHVEKEECHIIICIKNYLGIAKQLETMGIQDFHVFDPGNDYPSKKRAVIQHKRQDNNTEALKGKKPYHVGYIAGVFDLFHVGHLNMFKRAKDLCDYLIVGVVSDESVRLDKQVEPFIPFDERLEIVKSCKYVDEAVKLPLNSAGTRDMFRIYHFDVQFSGSDYKENPYWLAEKEFLEKNGSTMVFFPYTQSTSSTKLKKAIESRIENNK